MTPWRFVAFRVFTLTAGRAPALGRWLKRRLARALIHRVRPLEIRFRRVVELGEDGVRVLDELSGAGARQLEELRREDAFTTVHMGSARYFVPHEALPSRAEGPSSVDPQRVASGVLLERSVILA
jgi:hypothetical protein